MAKKEILLGDCLELMKDIPNGSIDALITDPPYTDGNVNVLNGHKIQTMFSIESVMNEFFRVLKKDSFMAFFGQMPTILEWHNQAIKAGFKFRIDIVWCKKKGGQGGNLALKKSHELIYVYSKGNPNYYKTNGEYTDVSQGQCEAGIKDIESVFRQLSYWKGIAQGKKLVQDTGLSTPNDMYFNKKGLKNKERNKTLGIELISFNSVWSFTTHNQKHRNPETGQIKHPTVKSIPLMERLIELLSEKDNLILEPFAGSGTTAIACLNTNRQFIVMEKEQKYYDIILKRVADFNSAPPLFIQAK
jgi:DNA modification methylase